MNTSAASYLEASIVLDSRGSTELSAELDRFLSRAHASIEPDSATQARIARGRISNSAAAPAIPPD